MSDAAAMATVQRRVPNFRRHLDRRDLILDAALQVFFEKGYERGRLEEVARLSGVGKSAVLYHFGSKLALVAAMVESHCLPATPVGHGTPEHLLDTGLADPAAFKVLKFVMTEQRDLPLLGRLYLSAMLKRLASWQSFGNADEARAIIGRAFGRVAARVLLEDDIAPAGSADEPGVRPI